MNTPPDSLILSLPMDLRRLGDIQCLILLTSKKTNLLVPCSIAPEAYSIINKILADILTLACMVLIFLPIPIQAQSLQQSIIWSPSSPAGTQVYRAFRKSFVLATNPPQASLQIFADSQAGTATDRRRNPGINPAAGLGEPFLGLHSNSRRSGQPPA